MMEMFLILQYFLYSREKSEASRIIWAFAWLKELTIGERPCFGDSWALAEPLTVFANDSMIIKPFRITNSVVKATSTRSHDAQHSCIPIVGCKFDSPFQACFCLLG